MTAEVLRFWPLTCLQEPNAQGVLAGALDDA
jgi:hypothetical protein